MKRLWFLLLGSLMSPAFAQVTLTSAGGTDYTVQATARSGLSAPANLANWPQLCVRTCRADACDEDCSADAVYHADGIQPDSVLNGQGIQTATRNLSGLMVRRHIFVPRAAQGLSLIHI